MHELSDTIEWHPVLKNTITPDMVLLDFARSLYMHNLPRGHHEEEVPTTQPVWQPNPTQPVWQLSVECNKAKKDL